MATGIIDSNGNETTVINAPLGMESQNNFYSIDGDDMLDFYNTASELDLRDALISNGLVRPAGTMVMLNGENLRIVNTTLDGLSAEDPALCLGSNHGMARFNNINAINVNSGTINIQNAIVDGLNVGGNATINLNGGQLNNFHINEDSNVALCTNGGTLNRVKFEGADIDERSSFANAVIRGGEITNCNFKDVDFTRADISDVHITGGDISGKFTGAMLRNMSIQADIRGMEVSDSTTFHNVNVFDPTLNQYRRVDNADQFRAIQGSYAMMEQVQELGAQLHSAMQKTQAPQPEFELRASPLAAIINPAALPEPDATQPAQMVSGGLTLTDETSAETITRVNGTMGNFQHANVDHNDVTLANQQALSTADALAAQRTAEAMKDFVRDDGRGGGRSMA